MLTKLKPLKKMLKFVPLLLACLHLPCVAEPNQGLRANQLSLVPDEPLEVRIGIQIDQIVNVDQTAENFQVVGTIRMEWHDAIAVEALGDELSNVRLFTPEQFSDLLESREIMAPGFLIHNQQGRRFSQDARVIVSRDGEIAYLERFTVTLQAPDFYFARYPFDTQEFFLRVSSELPGNYVRYTPIEGYSGLGEHLGEEEWAFERHWTELDSVLGISNDPVPRFSLGFEGSRHLNYYFIRIFIPLFIIIVVSWFTFFLFDYSSRVDMAVSNLLVFVAFNFTISTDLPRLGYLTFMDTVVFSTFVFSALVVLVNVAFRRMEANGHEARARQLDRYTLWIYPGSLVAFVLFCWRWFMA